MWYACLDPFRILVFNLLKHTGVFWKSSLFLSLSSAEFLSILKTKLALKNVSTYNLINLRSRRLNWKIYSLSSITKKITGDLFDVSHMNSKQYILTMWIALTETSLTKLHVDITRGDIYVRSLWYYFCISNSNIFHVNFMWKKIDEFIFNCMNLTWKFHMKFKKMFILQHVKPS